MCQIENKVKYFDEDLVVYKVFLTLKWEGPNPLIYSDGPKRGFFPPYHPDKAEFFIGEVYEEKRLDFFSEKYLVNAAYGSRIGEGFIHCFRDLESAKNYLHSLPMDHSLLVVGQCTIPKDAFVLEGLTQIAVDNSTSSDGCWTSSVIKNYDTYATTKIRLDKVCYVPSK